MRNLVKNAEELLTNQHLHSNILKFVVGRPTNIGPCVSGIGPVDLEGAHQGPLLVWSVGEYHVVFVPGPRYYVPILYRETDTCIGFCIIDFTIYIPGNSEC